MVHRCNVVYVMQLHNVTHRKQLLKNPLLNGNIVVSKDMNTIFNILCCEFRLNSRFGARIEFPWNNFVEYIKTIINDDETFVILPKQYSYFLRSSEMLSLRGENLYIYHLSACIERFMSFPTLSTSTTLHITDEEINLISDIKLIVAFCHKLFIGTSSILFESKEHKEQNVSVEQLIQNTNIPTTTFAVLDTMEAFDLPHTHLWCFTEKNFVNSIFASEKQQNTISSIINDGDKRCMSQIAKFISQLYNPNNDGYKLVNAQSFLNRLIRQINPQTTIAIDELQQLIEQYNNVLQKIPLLDERLNNQFGKITLQSTKFGKQLKSNANEIRQNQNANSLEKISNYVSDTKSLFDDFTNKNQEIETKIYKLKTLVRKYIKSVTKFEKTQTQSALQQTIKQFQILETSIDNLINIEIDRDYIEYTNDLFKKIDIVKEETLEKQNRFIDERKKYFDEIVANQSLMNNYFANSKTEISKLAEIFFFEILITKFAKTKPVQEQETFKYLIAKLRDIKTNILSATTLFNLLTQNILSVKNFIYNKSTVQTLDENTLLINLFQNIVSTPSNNNNNDDDDNDEKNKENINFAVQNVWKNFFTQFQKDLQDFYQFEIKEHIFVTKEVVLKLNQTNFAQYKQDFEQINNDLQVLISQISNQRDQLLFPINKILVDYNKSSKNNSNLVFYNDEIRKYVETMQKFKAEFAEKTIVLEKKKTSYTNDKELETYFNAAKTQLEKCIKEIQDNEKTLFEIKVPSNAEVGKEISQNKDKFPPETTLILFYELRQSLLKRKQEIDFIDRFSLSNNYIAFKIEYEKFRSRYEELELETVKRIEEQMRKLQNDKIADLIRIFANYRALYKNFESEIISEVDGEGDNSEEQEIDFFQLSNDAKIRFGEKEIQTIIDRNKNIISELVKKYETTKEQLEKITNAEIEQDIATLLKEMRYIFLEMLKDNFSTTKSFFDNKIYQQLEYFNIIEVSLYLFFSNINIITNESYIDRIELFDESYAKNGL